jgi:hypothetical protein
VIIEGTQSQPQIIATGEIACPQGYKQLSKLHWFYQEIEDLCKKHKVNRLAIKATEPMGRSGAKTVEQRLELETIALLAAAHCGVDKAAKKVKATIAKDFGFKGKAKYLSSVDESVLPNISEFSDKLRDAALVGWSALD